MKILPFVLVCFLAVAYRPLFGAGDEKLEILRQKKAEDALQNLKQAFEKESIGNFFEQVSDSPYLDYSDFKIKIVKRFDDFSQIQLFWSTDETLVEADKVSIRVYWQSRMVNSRSGKTELNKGRTQFIFKVKDKAKLVDIKGDYPF